MQCNCHFKLRTPPPRPRLLLLLPAAGAGSGGLFPSAVQKLLDVRYPLECRVGACSVFEGGGESKEALVQNMMEYILVQRF